MFFTILLYLPMLPRIVDGDREVSKWHGCGEFNVVKESTSPSYFLLFRRGFVSAFLFALY